VTAVIRNEWAQGQFFFTKYGAVYPWPTYVEGARVQGRMKNN